MPFFFYAVACIYISNIGILIPCWCIAFPSFAHRLISWFCGVWHESVITSSISCGSSLLLIASLIKEPPVALVLDVVDQLSLSLTVKSVYFFACGSWIKKSLRSCSISGNQNWAPHQGTIMIPVDCSFWIFKCCTYQTKWRESITGGKREIAEPVRSQLPNCRKGSFY